MTLQQLRYILAIAEHRNFTTAAQSENVAQPSMSVLVKKLEEELDLAIFDRSHRGGVQVTEVGEVILRQAKLILQECDRVQDLASAYKKKAAGHFKLGIIPTICPFLIPHFAKAFRLQHPEVHLHTIEDNTQTLMHRLSTGTLDAAILSTPEEAPMDLMEKVLYYEPFVIFGNPQHPILKSGKIKSTDLKKMEPLLLDETHCLRDQIIDLCQKTKRPDQGITLDAGSLSSLMAIVDIQNSFTLLPILALSGFVKEKIEAQVRLIVDPIPTRKISLVFNKSFVKRMTLEAIEESIMVNLPKEVHKRVTGKYSILEPGLKHFEVKDR